MFFSSLPLSSVARAFLSSALVALLFFGRSVPLFGCVGVLPLLLLFLLPLFSVFFLSFLFSFFLVWLLRISAMSVLLPLAHSAGITFPISVGWCTAPCLEA